MRFHHERHETHETSPTCPARRAARSASVPAADLHFCQRATMNMGSEHFILLILLSCLDCVAVRQDNRIMRMKAVRRAR